MRYTSQWIFECLLLRIKSRKSYEHIRTHKILPLPTVDTHNRYIKKIGGVYGFQKSVFDVFKKKSALMRPQERRGVLLLDEMKLTSSVSFNRQKLELVGFTNLGKYTPHHQANKRGDHALVLMFQPFQGKWVQSVACFLSKGCASSTILHQIIMEAIILTEEAGFNIDVVASDGATWNRSMWDKFGISEENISCEHITDPSRRLWFVSDFPHLIKNLRNYIVKSPETWTPDGVVKLKHWSALIEIQNPTGFNLKADYKITEDHIKPQYFQKMNVALAFQLFGVADAMDLFEKSHKDLDDSKPTQNFCRRVQNLINAMNTRTPFGALKHGNEAWQTIVAFLEYIYKWEETANNYVMISKSTCYGLKISLKATLEICKFLCEECGFIYLMTARLSQDALERFFGMMRNACGCNDHPDSTLFIQMYRLVSTYSLIKPPKGSNVLGGDFLDALLTTNDINESSDKRDLWEQQLDTLLDRSSDLSILSDTASIIGDHDYFKNDLSDYILTYVSGYVARKGSRFASIKAGKSSVIFENCIQTFRLLPDSALPERHRLIELKTKGYLIHPSAQLFNLISTLEKAILDILSTAEFNSEVIFLVTNAIDHLPHVPLVGCRLHMKNVTYKIVSFYVTTRMYFACKQFNKNNCTEKREVQEKRKSAKLVQSKN